MGKLIENWSELIEGKSYILHCYSNESYESLEEAIECGALYSRGCVLKHEGTNLDNMLNGAYTLGDCLGYMDYTFVLEETDNV